jgi:hypothetical protein
MTFTTSMRADMTSFLSQIPPGERILTEDLAVNPRAQTGWPDIRTNAAENMAAVGHLAYIFCLDII